MSETCADDLISRKELVETIERAQDSLISDNDKVYEKNKGYFKGLAWANHLVRTAPTVKQHPIGLIHPSPVRRGIHLWLVGAGDGIAKGGTL